MDAGESIVPKSKEADVQSAVLCTTLLNVSQYALSSFTSWNNVILGMLFRWQYKSLTYFGNAADCWLPTLPFIICECWVHFSQWPQVSYDRYLSLPLINIPRLAVFFFLAWYQLPLYTIAFHNQHIWMRYNSRRTTDVWFICNLVT